jgi:aconitate hydratase
MGVLPLQFTDGSSVASLGLTGHETFEISGVSAVSPGEVLTVVARRDDGSEISFPARARIDTPTELHYYRQGGILPAVLRKMLAAR